MLDITAPNFAVDNEVVHYESNGINGSCFYTLQDDLNSLLSLACKMETLGLPQTEKLTGSVIYSIGCQCPTKTVSVDTLKWS